MLENEATKSEKFIMYLAAISTVGLALAGFVLSFNSLTALATEFGVSIPQLVPGIVELGVVVFSFTALYFSLNGENDLRFRLLVAIASSVAIVFNILHAPVAGYTWVNTIANRFMFALPSLVLVLSFESFIGIIKHRTKTNSTRLSITKLTEILHGLTDSELGIKKAVDKVKLDLSTANLDSEQKLSELDEYHAAKVQQLDEDHQQICAKLEEEKNQLSQQIQEEKNQLGIIKNAQKEAKTATLSKLDIQAYQIDGILAAGATQTQAANLLGLTQPTVVNRIKRLNGDSLYHREEAA